MLHTTRPKFVMPKPVMPSDFIDTELLAEPIKPNIHALFRPAALGNEPLFKFLDGSATALAVASILLRVATALMRRF